MPAPCPGRRGRGRCGSPAGAVVRKAWSSAGASHRLTVIGSGVTLPPVTYEPDLQDELIGDAEALGGRAFVDQVTFEATSAADAVAPWDGTEDEPPGRRSTWLAVGWQLVAQRRAELGLPGTLHGDARPERAP